METKILNKIKTIVNKYLDTTSGNPYSRGQKSVAKEIASVIDCVNAGCLKVPPPKDGDIIVNIEAIGYPYSAFGKRKTQTQLESIDRTYHLALPNVDFNDIGNNTSGKYKIIVQKIADQKEDMDKETYVKFSIGDVKYPYLPYWIANYKVKPD